MARGEQWLIIQYFFGAVCRVCHFTITGTDVAQRYMQLSTWSSGEHILVERYLLSTITNSCFLPVASADNMTGRPV